MNIVVQPPSVHEASIALKPAELDALRANPWFRALPIELQRVILQRCAIWRVPAHQTLGTQSSVPDVWFGVAAGAVALSTQSGRGHQTIVDLLEPGQWFGDVPLLSGLPAPYEARTWAPSTLLLMRRSTLRELLGTRPELGPALLHLNWCQSARLMERITDQREPLLEQQARQLLARLTSRFGLPGRDATRITLSITQSQIALLLGSSRQRVNQALKRLERQGVFRRSQQSIIVPHRPTRSITQ